MRKAGLAILVLILGLAHAISAEPVKSAKPDAPVEMFNGIVMDDSEAEFTGSWLLQSSDNAIAGSSHHDGNRLKGQNSARFKIKILEKAKYIVRLAYTPSGSRASNVPVTIEHADGTSTVTVDQRLKPERHFVTLGLFNFEPGKPALITVSTAKTDGYVSVDGVQLVPTKD